MILNIINLVHRKDRLLSIATQAKEQGVTIKIWEGIIHENVCTGISRAFKMIVQDAKEKELPMVAIAEDDAVFTAPGAWQYFLDNMPGYFDMYLASYYSGLETYDHRIESYRGNTLIVVHQKFYDKFLNADETKNLDHALDFQGEYFVCTPWPAIQMPGYSDQLKKEVDYTGKTPEHKLFRGH